MPRSGHTADKGKDGRALNEKSGADLALRVSPAPSSAIPAAGNQALQRRALNSPGAMRPPGDGSELIGRALSAPAAPPGAEILDRMPNSLGDLSDVWVHTDGHAAEASRSIGARAFTYGRDVFFAANAYQPGKQEGRHLITHELAHAAQQRDANAGSLNIRPHEAAERDAESSARSSTAPTIHLDSKQVLTYPGHATPGGLVSNYTSFWTGLDYHGLGQRLYELAWMSPDHYSFVIEVMDEVPWGLRDDVAGAFVRKAREENLDEFGRTATGLDMLRRLKRELLGGLTTPGEGGEAIRLNNAIRRTEGAAEGRTRADAALDAAVQRVQDAPAAVQVQPIDPSQIGDRLRLVLLILDRLTARYANDPELTTIIADLEAEVVYLQMGPRLDPEGDAARVAVAQRILERSEHALAQLDVLVGGYQERVELGASQPHYVALATRVRTAWVDALEGAFSADAAHRLAIADAQAAALPRALTEIDLGILAHRQAGYEMTEDSGAEMVAWVNWVRDKLDAFETEARALAEARQQGQADLDQRETEFRNEADLIQLSIEGIQHWERALRAYEFLTGGFNLIPGAYQDVGVMLQRCANMKAAALASDVEDLRTRVEHHRTDPNVEQFYRAMPFFVGASQMLAGFAILLVAAMASAGVGALVAAPGASTAVVAGSVALEALTFTVVSRGLQGMVAPPPRTPFLVDLALNFGLFSVLRITGSAIRSALEARGLATFIGLATHTASYGILQAYGALHFRIEEGRWPTGDEIARMSLESLVMLAGVAFASGSVTRAITANRQLRALETLHNRYGLRLATIQIARSRLSGKLQTELSAGRGDDQIVIEGLRTEAEALNEQLRVLIEEVRADTSIGIADLRSALADTTLQQADIGGALLTRSLDLPERVGLRRSGGESQYTYEYGSTEPVVQRLQQMGAAVTEGRDSNTALRFIVGEIPGQPPMFFIERAEHTRTRLAELAETIERPGASKEDRQRVIEQVRTPHEREPGELEGFVLESTLAENQRAIAELSAQLVAELPPAGIIVGMEQGGAFLADVVGASNPALAPRVRHMPVHKTPAGEKFDGPRMQQEFQALIDGGATRIAVVDSYMGGTTAGALRDQVLLPVARRNPGVQIDVHWLRESLGFESRTAAGGVTLSPRRGTTRPTQQGGRQVTSDERAVRLVLGDDMSIVYNPASREPIIVFNREGRIVSVFYPPPGKNTRQLLIELLNRPAGP